MLDPGRDAPARDALAEEARKQIEDSGTVKHENNWGLRKLAYEIGQRTEADYRWFRFEAPSDLLERLDHSLKIADGVLRFRVFKVDPDAPVMAPPGTAAPTTSRERGGAPAAGRPRDDAAPTPPTAPAPAVAPAPAAAPPPSDAPATAPSDEDGAAAAAPASDAASDESSD